MSRRRWMALPAAAVVVALGVGALVQDDPDGGASDDDPMNLDGAVSILDCEEAPHDAGVGVYNFTSTFECEVEGQPVRLHGLGTVISHTRVLSSLTAGPPLPSDQRVDPLPGCAVVVVDGPDWVALTGTIAAGRSIADRTGGRQLPTTNAGPPISYPFCP